MLDADGSIGRWADVEIGDTASAGGAGDANYGRGEGKELESQHCATVSCEAIGQLNHVLNSWTTLHLQARELQTGDAFNTPSCSNLYRDLYTGQDRVQVSILLDDHCRPGC